METALRSVSMKRLQSCQMHLREIERSCLGPQSELTPSGNRLLTIHEDKACYTSLSTNRQAPLQLDGPEGLEHRKNHHRYV